MRKWWLVFIVVAFGAGGEAFAAGPEANPLGPWFLSDAEKAWHIDLLLGAETEPDYVGSDDSETDISGFARAHFRDRFGNLYRLGLGEVGAAFYFGERWALGVDLEYEEGRETENVDLQGLPDGDATLEGEFSLFRRWGNGYGTLVLQPDLLDRGKGIVYFVGYAYDHLTPEKRWLVSPRLDLSWGDSEHMQTEFGLTPAQAAILGLAEYAPGGGLKSTTAGLVVQRFLGRRWSLLGSVEVEHYFDKAADSPLIAELGSDINIEAIFGVYFRF